MVHVGVAVLTPAREGVVADTAEMVIIEIVAIIVGTPDQVAVEHHVAAVVGGAVAAVEIDAVVAAGKLVMDKADILARHSGGGLVDTVLRGRFHSIHIHIAVPHLDVLAAIGELDAVLGGAALRQDAGDVAEHHILGTVERDHVGAVAHKYHLVAVPAQRGDEEGVVAKVLAQIGNLNTGVLAVLKLQNHIAIASAEGYFVNGFGNAGEVGTALRTDHILAGELAAASEGADGKRVVQKGGILHTVGVADPNHQLVVLAGSRHIGTDGDVGVDEVVRQVALPLVRGLSRAVDAPVDLAGGEVLQTLVADAYRNRGGLSCDDRTGRMVDAVE